IVVENIPNWQNLFGSQDRVPVAPGVYGTDFSRIKPGSLVRAQGGYLVLNATDLLSEGSLWQAFKSVLRTGELVIQPPESQGAANAPILNPDPIPISVKVILLGSHRLYEVLCENDSDFAKIFKIKADFDTAIDFSKKSLDSYVDVIVRILRTEKLRDLDRSGLDQILQQSMRISGRKERLTTRFSHIADMLREADYHANREESALIRAEHVRTAVHDMHERLNLLEEKIQRRIHDGDVHIETEGETVGQLNGLTVISVGEHSFGMPARISCRVGVGKNGVLDIESEIEMSGSSYEKGSLILQGFITGRYALEHPLTFTASICIEQSYSYIDGDSASSTGLYVLMSSLGRIPLRQDLAVTGSVDQFGRIQPIGGANEKIEGFF
ncbi:MAG: AAA family ATPase, partial [Salinibacterium sp.]|nr:AAA family ATPase [Salinibacterium sp.]